MNRNRMNKKRMGRARVLSRAAAGMLAAALCFQPMTALAGPAGDSSLTSSSSNAGPGGGSGSSNSGSTGSSGGSTSVSNGGVSAVTSGLGVYRVTENEGIGAIARGVDVSYWQQNVNWSQVASDNVQFAMLATRFRGNVDPFFAMNAANASQAGLRLGAYIYSYATSVEMAQQEADFVLNLIKDYPISFPVVFDAEDANTLGTLTQSQVSDVINAFCKRIQDAGYYPMVYANEYWIANKIDMSKISYDIWVAKYQQKYTYSKTSMWQASNTGSVKGVNGNVDIDYLYKDYTQIIPGNTWRTIAGNRYYYQNHVMQKSAWINDGQNWYYMNAAGNPSKGWLELSGKKYYLEADGHMITGWKTLDGGWRYFDASGEQATGWRAVDGSWYFMADNGLMQTGWLETGGKKYYLNASGAMQAGWQNLGGSWYYFDGSGAMTTGWQAVGGKWYYMNESGVMQTGWLDLGGKKYYLDASGAMYAGITFEMDGNTWQAAADGSCTVVLPEENAAGNGGSTDGQTPITGSQSPVQPSGPAGV